MFSPTARARRRTNVAPAAALPRGLVLIAALLVAALLVALVAGGCGSAPGNEVPSSSSSKPGPSSRGLDTFAAEAALSEEAVIIVDVVGDVTNVDGERPLDDSAFADIVHAGLLLSDQDLTIALRQSAPLPAELSAVDYAAGTGEWLVFTLFLAGPEGEIIYVPMIHLTEAQWSTTVYDSGTGITTETEEIPTVAGAILTCTFPRDLMPGLTPPFRWSVGVEWSRSSGHGSDPRIAFGDNVTHDDSAGWSGYPYIWADYPE